MTACSDTDDYGNPYDPMNPLTGGSPPNVKVLPGDREATVTWFSMGITGIESYRVYRRFEGDPGSEFTFAGEEPAVVDASTKREERGHRYVFVDDDDGVGLMNDQVDPFTSQPIPYRYRLTVVDTKGVETPDPNAPPVLTEESTVYWPFERVTPSEAPHAPRPDVFIDDLWVLLSWADYQPPGDVALYRIYGSPVASGRRPELAILGEIPVQGQVATDISGGGASSEGTQQYTDTAFARDETTKEYLVTAVDRFGVESDRGLDLRFQATVPNLPPKPLDWRIDDVTGVVGNFQVDFSWVQAPEGDVDGYNIYREDPANPHGWRIRKTIGNASTKKFSLSERMLFVPLYFITAFDNTPREDGNFDQVYPPGYVF
jgi:hypothetical protein